MTLEYLFLDEQLKEEICKHKKENVNINIKDIENSSYWLAEFIMDENNEQSALALSEINEVIIKNYDCTTLINESAFYYNKKLYPLINEFERKLRKVLYLSSKLSNDSADLEVIRNLEEMDLGEIFELIFTDTEFIKNVKKTINSKSWQYNKSEIIDVLVKTEERTLWNRLLGDESSPRLQEEYIAIKNYRNNIMHAHNITGKDYKQIRNLFLITNKELDDIIRDILTNKIKNLDKDSSQNFNKTLKKAMDDESMDKSINDMDSIREQLKGIAKAVQPIDDMDSIREQLKGISRAVQPIDDMDSIKEQAKKNSRVDISNSQNIDNGNKKEHIDKNK